MPAAASSVARWIALPRAVDSPSRSRDFVREVLTEWGQNALIDDALLLVSELVSNSVLHAQSSLIVSVSRSSDCRALCISVHDDQADGVPSVRQADGAATSGRGLALVQKVASRWGIAPDPGGKSVWFELRV
jgi:anti-sigma regulatory factor (Ser/Thr protein kinase)